MIWIVSLILAIIFFEDLLHREVHWILFPVLLASVSLTYIDEIQATQLLGSLALLTLLLGGLTIYLFVRKGSFVNPLDGYFSLGDVLFLIAVIPAFGTKSYLMFFIGGTIVSLLVYGVINLLKEQKTIPYAGYMALFTIPVLSFRSEFNQLIEMIYGVN
jgi:hypothetical protein